jgi:hypothetical protein
MSQLISLCCLSTVFHSSSQMQACLVTQDFDKCVSVSTAPGSVPNKVRRKETWERLRRRGSSGRPSCGNCEEVWVRRESVETQTREDCSSLPRAVRPRRLPIKPQHHLRSSPSPSEDRDSPSSASLTLTTAPLSAELGNKSSSAPLLVKKAVSPGAGGGKPEDNAKKRVSAPLLIV